MKQNEASTVADHQVPKIQQRMIVLYTTYELDHVLQSDLLSSHDAASTVKLVAAVKKVNGYVPVSTIEYDSRKDLLTNLETAYRLHQNGVVTDSWTLSPPDGLHPLVDPIKSMRGDMGHRSMMMGDIVEFGGNQYLVCCFGFINAETGEQA